MPKKIYDVRGGDQNPEDPQWGDLAAAGEVIEAAGLDPTEFVRDRVFGDMRIAWRAKSGEHSDDGQLQSLEGIEVDIKAVRVVLRESRTVQ